MPRKASDGVSSVYLTTYFTYDYGESELPCRIEDELVAGKKTVCLTLDLAFDRFEWLEGDSGDTEAEPYDGDGEPHAVRAISTEGNYQLDISILSPAAKELVRLGLVEGAPVDAA